MQCVPKHIISHEREIQQFTLNTVDTNIEVLLNVRSDRYQYQERHQTIL